MKILIILLFPCMVHAQYRPFPISTMTPQALMNNFNQAAIRINRSLDKYGNDTIYGSPTFNKTVVFKGTNTFTGGNTYKSSTTFKADILFDIPSVSSFTRTCPTGFTSVQKQGNQLGCIQTAEEGMAQQVGASTMCFALYGARLPTMQETDIAFNAYTLTDEADDSEWLGDIGWEVTENGFLRQASGVPTVNVRTFMAAFRCWINR